VGLTTTSRGGSCGLGNNPDICAFPSIWGDDGDDTEMEKEGPKPTPTSNRVVSDTSTSPGCALAYESDKDGEGGAACKDVYLALVVEVGVLAMVEVGVAEVGVLASIAVEFGNPAKVVGVRAASCKKLDESTTGAGIHSPDVVVVVDGDHIFTQLPGASPPLDVEQGSMSYMILPTQTGVNRLLPGA
jgi:hypothetical protein